MRQSKSDRIIVIFDTEKSSPLLSASLAAVACKLKRAGFLFVCNKQALLQQQIQPIEIPPLRRAAIGYAWSIERMRP